MALSSLFSGRENHKVFQKFNVFLICLLVFIYLNNNNDRVYASTCSLAYLMCIVMCQAFTKGLARIPKQFCSYKASP